MLGLMERPEDFGPTGTADDTATFQLALDTMAASPNLRGGQLFVDPYKKYNIMGDLYVRPGIVLQGAVGKPGQFYDDYSKLGSQLRLGINGHIHTKASGGVKNCAILRDNVSVPAPSGAGYLAAANAIKAGMGGAAIIMEEQDGIASENIILGFDQAIWAPGCHRLRVEGNNVDCNSGLYTGGIYDGGMIRGNHFWPFLTVGGNGTAAEEVGMTRPGIAYHFDGSTDGTVVADNFCLGYAQGFTFNNATNPKVSNCWADYCAHIQNNTAMGWHLLGSTSVLNFSGVNLQASSQQRGFVFNATNADIHIANMGSWVIFQKHVDHLLGRVTLVTPRWEMSGVPGGAKAYAQGGSINAARIIAPSLDGFTVTPWTFDGTKKAKTALTDPMYRNCTGTLQAAFAATNLAA